jgi:hypothetical protein
MNYNLLDEDDNKFVVGNGDSSFSIAKYGLDDGFMEKLRMLPRVGYADGGMVEEPAPSALEAGLKAQSGIGDIFGAVASPIGEAMEAGLQAPTSRGLQFAPYGEFKGQPETPMTPVSEPIPGRTGASGTWAGATETPVTTPAAPTADTVPPYMKIGMGGGQPAPFMLPEDIRSGYEKMQQGTMAQAKAHADAAIEQARLYDEQAKDLELQQIAYRKQTEKLDSEIADLQKGIATQKIDPNRIWTNASTGNRVTAGISLLLGGLSQGLTGAKSNPAMDVINNAIDRDIDAQKAELGKKQNLLSLNLQKYGRLDQAFQATKMQIMAVTQAQINQQAAKMGSKQALAAAQVASGQMDVQMGMIKNQLAGESAKQARLTDPNGLTAKDLIKLDQETQARMVQLPNGNYYLTGSPSDAQKVKEKQAVYFPIRDLAREFYTEMERGVTLPMTARKAQAERLQQSMLLELKNLNELGALTKDDIALIEPLVPQIGKVVNPQAQKEAVDFIIKQVNNKLNGVYSAYVQGFNPSGRSSREQSIFLRK